MSIKGIDISAWNGNVDMKKIKADGVKFVMIRASYGKGHEDSQFRNNVKKCNDAGMPWGAYHYSYALNATEAKAEAKAFLKIVKSVTGRSYPLVVDIEDADKYKSKRGMTIKDEIPVIQAFKDVVGDDLMLYCNLSYYNTLHKASPTLISSLDLWLAHWGVNEPGAKCDIWQYSSDGKVNGSSSRTDMDKCYTDYTGASKPVASSTTIKKGQTVTLTANMKVRTGAGTSCRWKKRSELTADGKKHSQTGIYAVLKKGTKVTVLTVTVKGNDIWIRIPSGYVCAKKGSNKYVK